MSLRRTTPTPFVPLGLTDSIDGTLTQSSEGQVFGNMSILENLIPDPSTRGLWKCRPAASEVFDFTSFSTPGAVSCMYRFGRYVYGMVASALTPGYDQPFCYDVVGDANVAITGITAANVPLSPATSGEWVPPHMELVGVYIIITHPGYNGTTNFFGYINISNPAAPTYAAGNVTTSGSGVALPARPTWCAQYFGRAYFLVNPATGQPGAYFTDPLTLNISDASHILTFDDNTPLTCAKGMAYNTQLSGGVVQFLVVFKGISDMYQVQGDAALTDNPLRQNALNASTGTLAPNSVVRTPKGLMFMAPDGYRVIDFEAKISDPIGAFGQGVTVPFIYASVPSRVVAAYANGVMRVSVQNGYANGSPVEEYWLHTALGIWSGPHTFPASQIVPYDNTFIMAAEGISAKLWQSDVLATNASVYVENSTQLSWTFNTVMLPDVGDMKESSWLETTLDMAVASGMPDITFQAHDQDGQALSTATYTVVGSTTIWGTFTWGAAVWGGAANGLRPRRVDWPTPVVYRRVDFAAVGESRSAVRIGKLLTGREALGYLQQDN